MAKGYQKHILIGNLGNDPESRVTRTGKTVTNFDIAVNERNADGTEVTTWVRIAAWNGLGETCAEFLAKGRRVMVEGTRLKASPYIGQDGEAHASLELTADAVLFLDAPPDEEPEPASAVRQRSANGRQAAAAPRSAAPVTVLPHGRRAQTTPNGSRAATPQRARRQVVEDEIVF